jgi:response regulator of citrate/malate metabolism
MRNLETSQIACVLIEKMDKVTSLKQNFSSVDLCQDNDIIRQTLRKYLQKICHKSLLQNTLKHD